MRTQAVGGASPDRLSASLALDAPIGRVRGISPARAREFDRIGVRTVRDLLARYPRRYLDMSQLHTAASAPIASTCTVAGIIHEIKLKTPRPRLSLVEIALVDDTGLLMITCFHQRWLMDRLHAGMRIAVAGTVEFNYGFKRMTNPFIEVLDDHADAVGSVIPIHPATERLSAAWMRRFVSGALALVEGADDPLPLALRAKYRLMSRGSALRAIHFPHALPEVDEAKRRLAYEEVLLLELELMRQAARTRSGEGVRQGTPGPLSAALRAALPFALSADQERALGQIAERMDAPSRASHMLLGDVGTGKTVVAALACALACDAGGQALMMGPTEVLARQYGEKLGPLLDAAGIPWGLLTASTSPSERQGLLERLAAGGPFVLFGTHALLEDDVVAPACTLAVIDEQQRFGVDQRERLVAKGPHADALFMTATPIPRTLALALFGDMTQSYLREVPYARPERTTRVLAYSERGEAWEAIRDELARGHQAYIVCPLIDSSPISGAKGEKGEKAKAGKAERGGAAASGSPADSRSGSAGGASGRTADDDGYAYASISIEDDADFDSSSLKGAREYARYLQEAVFPDARVAVLHGRMRSDEKAQVMEAFRAGETDILVSTTVIEVGVDVPNATVMAVEEADRFGLAQLHQLRGRVGRGEHAAQVFIVSGTKALEALERLRAMERTDDGFELSEYDLSLRREGDILGNRQSGASTLKLVHITRDAALIAAAHADARELLAADPELAGPEGRPLAFELERVFGDARRRTEAGRAASASREGAASEKRASSRPSGDEAIRATAPARADGSRAAVPEAVSASPRAHEAGQAGAGRSHAAGSGPARGFRTFGEGGRP